MKALVCLLFFPAGIALWVLGSPQTAWRVFCAFRRRGPQPPPPQGAGYTALRVGATAALFSMIILVILLTRASD
ncbi:MAG: hypothetical protein ACRDT8_11080 [Micromonosporaceae bacterium]